MSWDELPISEADVRAYLDVTGTSGAYTTTLIGSNIRAAASFLERATGRQFERQNNTTKTFTSNGAAALAIPDIRNIDTISLQDSALTVDESYWLIADNRGIYSAVQFRAFGTGGGLSYLSNPQWFDRNLDRWGNVGSLPNDLVITGDWGHDPYPHDFLHAVKVLAAWYTRRPSSLLGGAVITPEGNQIDYSALPVEVQQFLANWGRAGSQLVAV
jgi:hypothetical protein